MKFQRLQEISQKIQSWSQILIQSYEWHIGFLIFHLLQTSIFITNKQSFMFQAQWDSLLASYFDFLDVNDASAVKKILDDASTLHTQRAQNRNPLRDEANKFITPKKEFEDNLMLSVNKESSKSLYFEIEPLIESIPVHIVKGLCMLRYMKARDFKTKLLNTLNYFREIQKRLTWNMMEMNSRDRINLNWVVNSPKDI